jgi:hypothetical protein
MTDDPNQAEHKAANARYCAHGVMDPAVRDLLDEIADRYEQAAAEHGPITKLGRQRKRRNRGGSREICPKPWARGRHGNP